MINKSQLTANWREGADAIRAITNNEESKKLLELCERQMHDCFKDDVCSIHDMEARFKKHLVGQNYSRGYVYNLMVPFHKILKASPTKEFFHEKADKWRKFFADGEGDNEYSYNKTTLDALTWFLKYVINVGLDHKPLTTTETQAFQTYLVTKGFNPNERAYTLARCLRHVLKAKDFYINEAKPILKPAKQLVPILEKMKKAALSTSLSNLPVKKTLREIRENSKDRPIKENTFAKISRDFTRYGQYQIDERGFKFKDWERVFTQDEVSDYLDYRNSIDDGITEKTAETIVASIATSLRLINKAQITKLSPQKVDEIKTLLWMLSKNFGDVFTKKSIVAQKRDSGGLPLYENLYSQYVEYVQKQVSEIRSLELKKRNAFNLKKRLIILICTVEYGWRPEDLAQTITLSKIKTEKTQNGEEFLFFNYTPSKTAWRKNAPIVMAPVAPWFKHIFDDYISDLGKNNLTDFIPKNGFSAKTSKFGRTMSLQIKKIAYGAFKQSLSANDFRRIHSNFFERRGIPALYRFVGRSANHDLLKLTEVEIKNYSEGGTSAEGLLKVRYGDEMQRFLNISWDGKKLTFTKTKPNSL